ncbi:MAG: DUF2155 domain-containing protein [Hyphomicrobiales bacterium]
MTNRTNFWRVAFVASTMMLGPGEALADRIAHPIAIFSGLDKITGRIVSFEVSIDETIEFGALLVTPKVCYTRPTTEPQNTTSFIEVDETTVSGDTKRLFNGWVFASSPGLSGVEHPIYDVWLIGCKGGTTIIPETSRVTPVKPDNNQPAAITPAKEPSAVTGSP